MQGKIETRVGVFVLLAVAVFVYMGFKIGSFRFDRARYNQYIVYFDDISGLTRKAEVKIAGVKVGWLESISLIKDHTMKVKADVMIQKNYALYEDSFATVRQDGLLGPKYIEIYSGDPLLNKLESGGTLTRPSEESVNIDRLLHDFEGIAKNVLDVSKSVREAVGGPEGTEQLKTLVDNLSTMSEKFSNLSTIIESSFAKNADNLDAFLEIGTNFKSLSAKLETDVFPSFQNSIEKISNVFDRDFDRIAGRVESTTQVLEDAAVQAREGLRNISSVAEKIDEGKGLLGKLVNEDETYRDLKVAVAGFKNYVSKVDRMQIIFDTHSEMMHRPAENYEFEDAKGYFDIRVHPNEEYFYQISLVNSQKGFISRNEVEHSYVDEDLNPIDVTKLSTTPSTTALNSSNILETTFASDEKLKTQLRKQKLKFERNSFKVGVQVGKIYKDIALRFGLFEGSAGVGLDIDIPFKTERFRWVTTIEAFDFNGWNRKKDRRTHVKWLNKMFVMRNIYFTFGADDFISKRNANAFFGVGVRFGDEDVKYLLSSLSGAASLVTY